MKIIRARDQAVEIRGEYGHQSPLLKFLWLDKDTGLHKIICKDVAFPNAQVISIKEYFLELGKVSGGNELINKFQELKKLKGIIK